MATQHPNMQSPSQYATSPWTEAYAARFEQASAPEFMAQDRHNEEEMQPTHDALADVYNRDFSADTSKRVLFA